MKNSQIILFGAGTDGRNTLNFIRPERVKCFVDNDPDKWGKKINGIPVVSPETLRCCDNRIYITASGKYRNEIEKQLMNMGVSDFHPVKELVKTSNDILCNEHISKLRGRFSGKRCFIIGTGPSLKISDLEKLKEKKEITFASNRIFKLFGETLWRPDLYCVSDLEISAFYYKQICTLDIPYLFLVNMAGTQYEDEIDFSYFKGENKFIFNIFKDYTDNWQPNFSITPERYVVDGGITVTYSMLQLAYFLGFKEVYLLGVDFNYTDLSGNDRNLNDHCCKDYISYGEKVNTPKVEESLKAYKVAEEFGSRHNFKIYNATRGGKLDVFERVDFEAIFGGE